MAQSPASSPSARLVPRQGPPAREPVSACCAGASHLSPCPGPPGGPALPGSLRAPPSALEADASSIAPFRRRTENHFFVREAGRNKASERSIPASGFFHALAGPPTELGLPRHRLSCLSCICLPLPNLGPCPPRGSPMMGAAGGIGCSFSPACRVWLQRERRRKERSLRW